MDRRRMTPKIEEKNDNQILVKLDTELDSDLKEFKETASNEVSEK